MASKNVLPLYRRLLKTKAALLAVSFTLIGVLLIMLNAWLATLSLGDWSWLYHVPLDEVGGPLLGAGLVSTILDYSYRRDQENVAIQRTQQAIIDLSPAKLWSVLCEGLARHPGELARLTTPERLDDAAAAIMAQRLGDEPVRIRQLLRVVTPSWGHRLFVELPQPTRGLSLRVDYTDTAIAEMMTTDTVAATQVARVHRSPKAVSNRVVLLDMPGWLLAKTGFAVTWTLESELPHDAEHREAV